MSTFIFRAECLHDAISALYEIQPLSYKLTSPRSVDVNIVLKSEKGLQHIAEDLAKVPDSHVMIRTLLKVHEVNGQFICYLSKQEFEHELQNSLEFVRTIDKGIFLCKTDTVYVTVISLGHK